MAACRKAGRDLGRLTVPRISKAYLARIDALPWPSVLGSLGITPPREARNPSFFMRCGPQDRTPSLRFDAGGRYHCFRCGCNGSKFNFVLSYLATGGHTIWHVEDDPFDRNGQISSRHRSVFTPKAYRAAIRHFAATHAI